MIKDVSIATECRPSPLDTLRRLSDDVVEEIDPSSGPSYSTAYVVEYLRTLFEFQA